MILDKKKVLPYYKIEKTIEGKEFFYSHIGYFNFWDEYLILHTTESNGVYVVLVNRPKTIFNGTIISDKQKSSFCNAIATSVYYKKPEEMFEDFPELNKWL